MKWTTRMLDLAALAATWSKDPSTRVGAVITDARNRVVSLGFNGFAAGVHDHECDRDEKLERTIHAEENAILFAGRSLVGCTMYVTHPPCGRCAAKIIQAGITQVVHHQRPLRPSWAPSVRSAINQFAEASVGLQRVDPPADPREVWISVMDQSEVWRHVDGRKGLSITQADCERLGAALGL